MATLTTTAVIRAHDKLTGPLTAMAGRVRAIQGAFGRGVASIADAGRRATTNFGLGSAFGIGVSLEAVKEFEKRIFGIGVATVPDAMHKSKDAVLSAQDAMVKARGAALELSSELGQSINTIGEIMESGVKGGMGVDRIEEFGRAIGLLRLTDPEASAEGLAAWGIAIDALYEKTAKASGLPWGEWFKKQADIAAVAAAETQLSTGTFIEGMRQFQALHSATGVSNEMSAALLASGVRAGQNAVDVGQTLKSNILRVLIPTLPNLRAWEASGLNRSDYFRGETYINDPMKVAGSLAQLSGGLIAGKERTAIQQLLLNAQNSGVKASDTKLQTELARLIGKSMGLDMRQDDNRERVADMIGTALFTGKEIDAERMYRDIVEKKLSPAVVAQMFEPRRGSTNQALFSQIESGFFDELLGKFRASNGLTLDNTQRVFDQSKYGEISRTWAAVSRLNARLWQTGAMTNFLETLNSAAEGIDRINPKIMDFGANALLLGLASGPLMIAAGGLGRLAMAAQGAGKLVGALTGGAMLRSALGLRSLSRSVRGLEAATGLAFGGTALRHVSRFTRSLAPAARLLGPIGVAIAGFQLGKYAYDNWDKIAGFFEKLGNMEGTKQLFGAWDRFVGAAGSLGGKLKEAFDHLMKLFGFDTSKWALIDAINGAAKAMAYLLDLVTKTIEGIERLFGPWGGKEGPHYPPSDPSLPPGSPGTMEGFGVDPQGGMPTPIDLSPIQASSSNLEGATANLTQAAQSLNSLPGAIRSAIENANLKVNVNAPSSSATGSPSPAPRTENGAQRNGSN